MASGPNGESRKFGFWVWLALFLFGLAIVNCAMGNFAAAAWVCGIAAVLGCVEQALDAYRCAREDREDA